jgi:hypothetical protein
MEQNYETNYEKLSAVLGEELGSKFTHAVKIIEKAIDEYHPYEIQK